MILPGLACAALAIATFNALLFLWNLRLYSPPPSPKRSKDVPAVSVLIPARNEEHVIAEAVTRISDGSIAGMIYDPSTASLAPASGSEDISGD